MNCDEAFDALTDSTDRESEALRMHLLTCPRCRQMRDVLAPALSLFDAKPDSPYDDGGKTADAIRRQFLSVEAVQIAKQAALELSSGDTLRRALRPARTRSVALQAAAAGVAAIVALAVVLGPGGFRGSHVTPMPSPPTQPIGSCLWTHRTAQEASMHDSHAVVASCVACHFDGSVR